MCISRTKFSIFKNYFSHQLVTMMMTLLDVKIAFKIVLSTFFCLDSDSLTTRFWKFCRNSKTQKTRFFVFNQFKRQQWWPNQYVHSVIPASFHTFQGLKLFEVIESAFISFIFPSSLTHFVSFTAVERKKKTPMSLYTSLFYV